VGRATTDTLTSKTLTTPTIVATGWANANHAHAASNSGGSAVGTTVTVTDNESTDESNLVAFVADAGSSTGNHGLEMDGDLTYNPSTGRLTATQLAGTLQTASQTNITAVGTIATGVWEGTTVAVAQGGTGQTSLTTGAILIGNSTSAVQMLAVGSNDQVLTADSGAATGVKWADAGGGAPTMVTKSAYVNRASTSRATLITPTSGQKVRIVGVIIGIQGAAMGELYFGTGANISSTATKAIMSTDRGTDDEGYTISFPSNGGPVGDADEVVSVRETATSGVNADYTVHYTEE